MNVQSIVKTRRGKDLTVKLVCNGLPEAEEMEEMLNDQIDSSNHLIEKMQALYGLKSVSVSLVHHQVFIMYKFTKENDAKDFEVSFVKYIVTPEKPKHSPKIGTLEAIKGYNNNQET